MNLTYGLVFAAGLVVAYISILLALAIVVSTEPDSRKGTK